MQDIADDGLYHPTSDSRLRMNLVQGNNYGSTTDYPTPAQQAMGLECGSVLSDVLPVLWSLYDHHRHVHSKAPWLQASIEMGFRAK